MRSIFIRALTEALYCMRMMETDMHMSRGKDNQISLTWKDDERCSTIGAAEHTFAQGLKGRECRVILEGDKVEKRFVYDGKERRISL